MHFDRMIDFINEISEQASDTNRLLCNYGKDKGIKNKIIMKNNIDRCSILLKSNL